MSFPSLQIAFGYRRQRARGSKESSDISRSSRSPSARRCQRPRSVEKREHSEQADGLTDGEATPAWQLGSAVDGSATNVSEWCGILTPCRKTRSRSRGVDMRLTSVQICAGWKGALLLQPCSWDDGIDGDLRCLLLFSFEESTAALRLTALSDVGQPPTSLSGMPRHRRQPDLPPSGNCHSTDSRHYTHTLPKDALRRLNKPIVR